MYLVFVKNLIYKVFNKICNKKYNAIIFLVF